MNGQSAVEFPGNSRVHIALAVADLQRSRRFYEILLDVPPSKERPGYIKFEPQDPSVNLTLNEVSRTVSSDVLPMHYGVQVKSAQAVQDAISRFTKAGLKTTIEENTTCCYAVQDKVWVEDPDGHQWEVFVVLEADAAERRDDTSACCAAASGQPATGPCC